MFSSFLSPIFVTRNRIEGYPHSAIKGKFSVRHKTRLALRSHREFGGGSQPLEEAETFLANKNEKLTTFRYIS